MDPWLSAVARPLPRARSPLSRSTPRCTAVRIPKGFRRPRTAVHFQPPPPMAHFSPAVHFRVRRRCPTWPGWSVRRDGDLLISFLFGFCSSHGNIAGNDLTTYEYHRYKIDQ